MNSIRRSPLSLIPFPRGIYFIVLGVKLSQRLLEGSKISQTNLKKKKPVTSLHHQQQGCIERCSVSPPSIVLPVTLPSVELRPHTRGPNSPWDSAHAQMPAWLSTTQFILNQPCQALCRCRQCVTEARTQLLSS